MNFTTSEPRLDGQSSPFTASSSQNVHGMRNCRSSIVAETEKPSLTEHQRLYIHCCLLVRAKKNHARLFRSSSDSKSSRRGGEFTLSTEVRERTKPSVCCCTYTAVLLYVAHSHSSSTPRIGMPHAHDDDVACCCLCCWARL